MNCEAARERLLEVDLDALGTELERHLQGCDTCQTVAERFRAAEQEMDHSLGEIGPTLGSAEAVAVALSGRLAELTDAPAVPAQRRFWPPPGGSRDWKRLARWAPLPLAAAAALSGLLMSGGPGSPAPSDTRPSARRTAIPPAGGGFEVDVPTNRRVAVFETRDPAITVVWFLDNPTDETAKPPQSAAQDNAGT